MKFLSVLLLSAAGSAIAEGGGGRRFRNGTSTATSTKGQCRQVARLTELTSLAADETKLEEITKNNATRVEAIKAKASAAAEQLATLSANSTLMATCEQIFAVNAMEDACQEMAHLEKLQALVANQTALDEKTKNNATRADALKAKVEKEAADLTAMQSNATLTQFCSVQTTKETCRDMSKLQKQVDMAANTTALEAKFDGNTTKIERFQAKVAEKKAELEAMQGNSTLVEMCASLKSESGSSDSTGLGSSTSEEQSQSSGGVTAGAGALKPLGTMMASLGAVSLFGLLIL
ncbi:hypothetical protein B0H66DRAFT_337383 [Apodospora peruviana]|uniref:Uncharacterized protein n=1 Tax=Apodospora peruviana TaxID=516989 RepID=A0AAE0M252_9PEZI|nr:hypothetical protein B0H66DRAFT_337383 [Apodospora peruviana]